MVNRRTFRGTRGRPSNIALSDEEIPTFVCPLSGKQSELNELRKKYESSFRDFLFDIFDYHDLDRNLHGSLANFVSAIGVPSSLTKDRYFPNRVDMISTNARKGESIGKEAVTEDRPYGVDLDGNFRGCLYANRGDRHHKLILMPRGHLKSSVVTVAYVVWRIIKNPAIRVLVVNAKLDNAKKFLAAQKWQFTHNEKIEKFWPDLHIDKDKIYSQNITWGRNSYSVPRKVDYDPGEDTVEAVGILGNLVSRHYNLVVADDLVSDKNSRSSLQIELVLDNFQNMHSLLEPDGETVVIGTRWDYTDLYSTLLYKEEWNKKFSVFICTCTGKDELVFFPQKYNGVILEDLEAKLGTYKFSCQYQNQPVDSERAEFKSSWLRFHMRGKEDWSKVTCNTFCMIDPAFTEEDGDATGIVVVSVDVFDNWWIRRSVEIRAGDIPSILDAIFAVVKDFPELMTLGIESRGFQRAIAHGLYEEMEKRDLWFPIKEIKTESNRNKKWRVLQLAPRFRMGKIYIEGRNVSSLEGGMKALAHQYLRFPRGHDDLLDALAYGCDVVFKPDAPDDEVSTGRPDGEMHPDRLKRLARVALKKIHEHVRVRPSPERAHMADENMGEEF